MAHTERIPMCPTDKDRDHREREQHRDRDRDRDRERERESSGPGPGPGHGGSGIPCFSPAGLGLFPHPPPPPRPSNMSPHFEGPLRLPQLPHMPHISFTESLERHCSSPLPRRKQVTNINSRISFSLFDIRILFCMDCT